MVTDVRITVTLGGKGANWEWVTWELSRVLKVFFILMDSGYMGVHKNLKQSVHLRFVYFILYKLYLNENLI